MFHFHGFQNHQGGTGFNGVALADEHFQNFSGHGGDQASFVLIAGRPRLDPFPLVCPPVQVDPPNIADLGRKYAETVMGLGGSLPAAAVFKLFRGRAPTADALLRHSDLAA